MYFLIKPVAGLLAPLLIWLVLALLVGAVFEVLGVPVVSSVLAVLAAAFDRVLEWLADELVSRVSSL